MSGDPATTNVEYKITLGVSAADSAANNLTQSIDLSADLGLPGLHMKLNATVSATASLDYSLTLDFGLANNVFYVGTAPQAASAAKTSLTTHLNVSFDSLTNLTGSVRRLRFSADVSPSDPLLDVTYSSKLVHVGGQLPMSEIQSDLSNPPGSASHLDLQSTFKLQSDLVMGLEASFGGSAINPKLAADFALHWAIATGAVLPEAAPSGVLPITSLGGTLTVSFDHVRIDLADGLFSSFVKPLLDNIRQFTGPIEPVISALNQKPFAVFGSGFPGSEMTFLDVFSTFMGLTSDDKRFFHVVTDLVTLVKQADNATALPGGLTIELGSFTLADAQSSSGASTPSPRSSWIPQVNSQTKPWLRQLLEQP